MACNWEEGQKRPFLYSTSCRREIFRNGEERIHEPTETARIFSGNGCIRLYVEKTSEAGGIQPAVVGQVSGENYDDFVAWDIQISFVA